MVFLTLAGFPDCPDGLDEALGLCKPEDLLYIAPLLCLFISSFALAIGCVSRCRLKKNEDEIEQVPNQDVTSFLYDLKDYLTNPTMLKKKRLLNKLVNFPNENPVYKKQPLGHFLV